jgi:hypothetical protein
MKRCFFAFAALIALSASLYALLPEASRALHWRIAAEQPEKLADLQLAEQFDQDVAVAEIQAALDREDIELAESFVALADSRSITVPAYLMARLDNARTTWAQAKRAMRDFGHGFVVGNPETAAGMAGATAGDLLFYGDVRDLAREGWRAAQGQQVDPLIASLAAAGLAVTVTTYMSDGLAAPARTGISLFKASRRAGKLSANLVSDASRLARSGGTGKLVGAFSDLGKIESKAGARTAVEGLRHADNVTDLTKVGALAEKNGSKTLAILKTLGRGAFALGAGALTASLWVMGAAVNIFLIVIAISTLFASLVRLLWPAVRYAGAKAVAA